MVVCAYRGIRVLTPYLISTFLNVHLSFLYSFTTPSQGSRTKVIQSIAMCVPWSYCLFHPQSMELLPDYWSCYPCLLHENYMTWYHRLCMVLSLASLSPPLRSLQVIAGMQVYSFSYLSSSPCCGYRMVIHLPAEEHLSYFQFGASVCRVRQMPRVLLTPVL